METRGDPRDETWETEQSRCRVHFHDSEGASDDEYEVEGAEAAEVLA